MNERFAPKDERRQNQGKNKRGQGAPLQPKEEEDRQAEERDDLDLTTQGEENPAPNGSMTRTLAGSQDQE